MSAQPDSAAPFSEEAVAALVHELQTPVTTIRALAELMRDTPGMDDDERRGFLAIIADESLRLGRLVDDVLDAARLGSDEAEWQMKALDPLPLIEESTRTSAALMRQKGIDLSVDLPATAPAICGDRDRLLQVMLNLLSNAAKAAPGQGGRVIVSLTVKPEGVIIRVADNGPGIPPEDREAVFQRFRRLGQPGARPQGTGLGLSISRRIVQRHGGRLWVEASEGGACLAILLPLPVVKDGGT